MSEVVSMIGSHYQLNNYSGKMTSEEKLVAVTTKAHQIFDGLSTDQTREILEKQGTVAIHRTLQKHGILGTTAFQLYLKYLIQICSIMQEKKKR